MSAEPAPAVLFLLPWQPDAPGGVNRVVLSLLEGFTGSAYRPVLLVNDYARRSVTYRTCVGLPAFYELYLPTPFSSRRRLNSLLAYVARLPVALWRFIRLIRREKVAVVNLHYPDLSAVTVLLARFLTFGSFKVVLSFHGADLPRRSTGERFRQLIWRFIFRHSDATVACSRALAAELQGLDIAPAKVHVVHNAIDLAACRRKARQSSPPMGLEHRRYLLSVGKFEDKKAHDVLIQSFECVAPRHPELCLAIIGASGPALDACRMRVAASMFRDRILLYRDVAHGATLAAIARATLFVLPSRREPFGIVLLEAAALGIPVVASHVGGIPEIIEDGYSGVLVSPDDVLALKEGLERALSDPTRAVNRAAFLQASVRAKFDLAAQVRAYQDLFHETGRLNRLREAAVHRARIG